jgi:asparagine synthase (glutamine-hydrolysing)
MCGISGIVVHAAGAPTDAMERQLAALTHRGPDADGFGSTALAAVGQNRLAIIDLVDGDPPIRNEDGTVIVALNGEIYNFRELRDQLSLRGHRLATHGDTEVIAHLAEEHDDPAGLARALDGMFAFAVWDDRRRRLVIGRDRAGKKPLYYWSSGETFVFASEIKGILASGKVDARLDPAAIAPYLTFGYVPTPGTFYEGIRSLPPGHVLTLDETMVPRIEPYWRLEVPGAGGPARAALSMQDAAAEVRRLLEAAVERRMVADVPLGAFLSGGIDSSAIVGVMARLSTRPVETFTIGFEDRDGFDERPHARAVAELHRTNHHEHVVAPDAVDLVERLVWHHDQPFGDSSAIPTFLLSEVTRRDVTVALSGDGGDEVFGGYERFAAALATQPFGRLPGGVRRGLAGLLTAPSLRRVHPGFGKVGRFARAADAGLPDALASWVSFIDAPSREALLGEASDAGMADFRARWERTRGAAPLDRILALNFETYLLDDLLVKADRMSMAHALEVRSPFLDTALIEFSARLPPRLKVRGLKLKRVLKEAVSDLMPAELLHRPKRGFGVPLDRWFREDLAGYVDATLGAPDAHVRDHLQGPGVDRLLREHRSGARDHGHALWTLLTLEVFLRRQGW